MIPTTILVECNGTSFRKICNTNKDFSGNTYIRFKKIELEYMELENNFKPFEIIEWKKHSEIKSFSEIKKYFNIPEYIINNTNKEYNKLQEEYGDSPNYPDYGVKIGGTTVATQNQDAVLEYDLLQLSYAQYINYSWGDAGIAHISEDCHLVWDCC